MSHNHIVACRICYSPDHVTNRCPDAQCKRCAKKGHTEKGCDLPSTVRILKCAFCHKDGHEMNYCKKIYCRTCGAFGHTDRVCKAVQCTHCLKFGHESANCWFCDICKTHGHTTDYCFKKNIPPKKSQYQIDQKCTKCLKRGHIATNCVSKPFCGHCRSETHHIGECKDKSNHYCSSCGEYGHVTRGCTNPYIYSTSH